MSDANVYMVGRTVFRISTETGRFTDSGVTDEKKKKTGMTGKQCMDAIGYLSNRQGFYSSLYSGLRELERDYPYDFDEIIHALEAEHFTDVADMILYLEQ